MAAKPMFYTVRKHWKKSLFAACLSLYGAYYASGRFREYLVRREICNDARKIGQETISPLEKPRRMYVFLNPQANNGTALKLYEKNVAPVLHLAAIDVTLIKTDYEGHAKTILGYIDPSIDGIIVAGGDGTLLEVITGFIRLQDKDVVSQIPIGLIPLGKTNRFFNREHKGASENARTLGNATMSIIKGNTKQVDVMEITSNGVRPTYCLSGLNWGLLQEVKTKIDAKKHWWAGPWKKQMAFVTRTIRNWPLIFSASLHIDKCYFTATLKSRIEDGKSLNGEGTDSILTPSLERTASKNAISTDVNVDTSALNLQIGTSSGESRLQLQLWDSHISRADFVKNGVQWMKNNYDIVQSDNCKEFYGEHVTFSPNMDHVTWFHIDGEEFEAKDIEIKLLRNKLKLFH